MSAKKPTETVEVDGVKVVIKTDYPKSWDGVKAFAEMKRLEADENATDDEKFLAVLDYVSNAVDIDKLVDDLGGGSVPVEDVLAVVFKALAESSAKN